MNEISWKVENTINKSIPDFISGLTVPYTECSKGRLNALLWIECMLWKSHRDPSYSSECINLFITNDRSEKEQEKTTRPWILGHDFSFSFCHWPSLDHFLLDPVRSRCPPSVGSVSREIERREKCGSSLSKRRSPTSARGPGWKVVVTTTMMIPGLRYHSGQHTQVWKRREGEKRVHRSRGRCPKERLVFSRRCCGDWTHALIVSGRRHHGDFLSRHIDAWKVRWTSTYAAPWKTMIEIWDF